MNLWTHQQEAVNSKKDYKKCYQKNNIIVFPSYIFLYC